MRPLHVIILLAVLLAFGTSQAQTRDYDFVNAVKRFVIRDSTNNFFLARNAESMSINYEDLLKLKDAYNIPDTAFDQLRANNTVPAGMQTWDCEKIPHSKCLEKKLVDSITSGGVDYLKIKTPKKFFWQKQRYHSQYIPPPYEKEFGHEHIWSISKPALDRAGNYALVSFSYLCVSSNGLCGYIGKYFFVKKAGIWIGYCFWSINS